MEHPGTDEDGFARSRTCFDRLVGYLDGGEAARLDHSDLEDRLDREGRELLRLLFQDHLDLRAVREPRLHEVTDADGAPRPSVEVGHTRALTSVFGQVRVPRLAYRARGHANLHPADAALNLPVEKHSHGLRKLAAVEASRGSFDDTADAITRATGVRLGKRQAEELAGRAAVDFDDFYAQRRPQPGANGDVLVLSADGKGIVMRPEALRPATAKAAETSTTKLPTRLSKGEKRNRKRLAEVGAVYDTEPVVRTPADILARGEDLDPEQPVAAPVAANKWLTASVADDAATVVGQIFDEAERRDPDHGRTWIALVDGNNHQIDRIRAEAATREADVTILCDFIHVLEYLWKAAWSFHDEGDPAAEQWVRDKAIAVLQGKATTVAAGIRRAATRRGLDPPKRAGADTCATYLINKARHLDYPTALAAGWPIATGVIEGACRYLVKDRMDITGARWGLHGAEAVLKLRALRSNRDWDDYWRFHLAQERRRIHETCYLNSKIPTAA
ncbi:MAG: ISKra4 family transposase [Propionibacterium sp.]|jgi:hypothetical protein|nr:ISKra4 family transposase [Propionibacterium sp.]